MKHIKPYKLFEKQEPQHPGFPTTEKEIHRLCNEYDIKDYTINNDLSIDVNGSVFFHSNGFQYLPLNFNYITVDFYCYDNHLISLEGSPQKIDGHFFCYNNRLETLKGGPNEVGGAFSCDKNILISLEGCPKKVGSVFCCNNNDLRVIDYLPEKMNNFEILYNPIECIFREFIYEENLNELVDEFNEYSIIRSNDLVWVRLEVFCNDFGLNLPDINEVKEYYNII